MNIISQGAEAIISLKNSIITKNRTKKSYRLPVLDQKLRTQRTKKEARILQKASLLIPVPKLLSTYRAQDTKLEMEHIEGKKLSEYLDSLPNSEEACHQIGNNIAKLHDAGIIHGDLTTSNMILSDKNHSVYFIDFGLGFESNKPEDKAVDLHLIRQALEARHFSKWNIFWDLILESYKKASKNSLIILKRLEKVEKRGRYKSQY